MTACPWCQAQCGVWTITDPLDRSTWLPLCAAAFHMTHEVPSESRRRSKPGKVLLNRMVDERREYTELERRIVVSSIVANDITNRLAPWSPCLPSVADGAQTSWMFV